MSQQVVPQHSNCKNVPIPTGSKQLGTYDALTAGHSFRSYSLLPVSIVLVFLVVASAQLSGTLSARYALLASLILFGPLVAAAIRRINRHERSLLAGLLTASLFLEALPEMAQPSAASLYEFSWRASLVLLGWSFAFSLFRCPTEAVSGSFPRNQLKQLAALTSLSFIALSAVHWAVRGRYGLIIDEVLYVLQSKLILMPGFGRHLDQWMTPFFIMRQSYVRNGALNGQYPPGWPLLLAAFNHLGVRWFAPICMGTVAVVFTYLLGKLLRSHAVGLLAGILILTDSLFVFLSSTYLSHISTIALAVAAGWMLIKAEKVTVRDKALLWTLVGLTLGMIVAIRPLTGVAISLSLWMWVLVRGKMARSNFVSMTITLTLASALPLAFFLYYNKVTTGAIFSFGYQLASGTLNNVGFGLRGGLIYEAGTAAKVYDPTTQNFTLHAAVVHLLLMLRDASFVFTPAFFFMPLLALAIVYKVRLCWRCVLVFLALPLLHFFYFFQQIRFYAELLPFAMVGIAVMVDELAVKSKVVACWAMTFLITGNILFTAGRMWKERQSYSELRPYLSEVVQLRREKGKLLVFVNDKSKKSDIPILFDCLAWFDVDSFPDVIVARDLGERDIMLIRKWPDHFPVRVRDERIGEAPVTPPRFVPISSLKPGDPRRPRS